MTSVLQGFALFLVATAVVYFCIQAIGSGKSDDEGHGSHGSSHGHH